MSAGFAASGRKTLGCCAAALAGLGVARLPEDSCVEDVRRGGLVHVLPQWSTPEGVVRLVFTTTRGMLPAVRAFIDHFAQAFSVMRGRGRMLVPDHNEKSPAAAFLNPATC
jgi:DNA-binding transcriptional LysR family regulator